MVRRRGVQGLVLLAAVLVLLVLGGAGPASAHAALRGTDPADGSVLRTAPRQLTLTFTESVGLLDDSVRVIGPDGRRLRVGAAEHGGDSDTARVALPRKMDEGTYTVAWRVVSEDSHPVSGAFTFSVGKPSPTPAVVDAGPTEDPTTAALHKMARYLAYLSVCVLIGTAVFVVVCRPGDTAPLRRPALIAWWTLTAATVALFFLRGPYESGEGLGAAFSVDALTRTLQGRPGWALLARLGLLMLVAAGWLVRRRLKYVPVLGGVTAVALAATWAASDHASAGIQVPVAMTSAVLHLLATAVWLGGLAAMALTLRGRALTPETVTRFSRLAFASVAVLVVTGVYQSWRGLGSWNALTETTYGRLLTFKLVAVVLLLGAAAVSRSWTRSLARAQAPVVRVPEPVGGPPLPELSEPPAPPAPDHRALRRSVLAEVAVGVVVLVLTTVLTATVPGRAVAEAGAGAETSRPVGGTVAVTVPFDVGTPGGSGKVEITLDPGRVGDNSLQAVVFAADGGLATVPELKVSFTNTAQDIGPLDAGLTDKGGYWGNSFVNLPLAGTWTMKVTVRVSEIDQVTVERTIEIT
ncbi:copper transport protein [Streptomyces sp. DI166]|nr:copper transport protein [Streptomyces sp. DI166]